MEACVRSEGFGAMCSAARRNVSRKPCMLLRLREELDWRWLDASASYSRASSALPSSSLSRRITIYVLLPGAPSWQ